MKIKVDILKELLEKGESEVTRILIGNVLNIDRSLMLELCDIRDNVKLHIFVIKREGE